jgi:hypothetical protein
MIKFSKGQMKKRLEETYAFLEKIEESNDKE